MSPEQEQLLDEAILGVLDQGDSSFGLSSKAIKAGVVRSGFPAVELATIDKRLAYMAHDQVGFVSSVGNGDFHSNLRTWRISPRGTNHLRAQGL